ncbi:MAG: zinc ribbon-containing protein [Gammaproteobacteria bacterium]
MTQQDTSREEKLIHGYNRMMERVKAAMEQVGEKTAPRLREAIEQAKEKAVELEELTKEEAERIGEYLRRDIESAADYLASEKVQELKDWLRIDAQLIEQQLLDMFLSVADQTKLDMLQFQEQLEEASEYRTGEITGPGTLACLDCGEILHFHKTSHIPPCPKCHGTVFTRDVERVASS